MTWAGGTDNNGRQILNILTQGQTTVPHHGRKAGGHDWGRKDPIQ